MQIGTREIGGGHPVYIVAEMSANHNQDLGRAKEMIRAAAGAGADAIKLQTYTPESLTIDCDREWFRIKGTLWDGKSLYQLYQEAATPWEWHRELQEAAAEAGLDFFSTPFDAEAVAFLEELRVPVYKIASFELVDHCLLQIIGATGKPVILSTGMATLGEIDEAVGVLRRAGAGEIALLQCTSAYPAPVWEMNLRTIPHLAEAFGVVAGLSDHTTGMAVPVAAVALGAAIVEKHFTLSRADGGPDSAFSLEPAEFGAMVRAIRETEQALGRVCYELTEKERQSRMFRRSLFVVADVEAGEVFSGANIRSIRPGAGLAPKYYDTIIGRRARTRISRGTPLTWDLVA